MRAVSDQSDVSTPPFSAGMLGPLARRAGQALWDRPTRPWRAAERRDLQDRPARELVCRVLETPVPLFAAKLTSGVHRGGTSPPSVVVKERIDAARRCGKEVSALS